MSASETAPSLPAAPGDSTAANTEQADSTIGVTTSTKKPFFDRREYAYNGKVGIVSCITAALVNTAINSVTGWLGWGKPPKRPTMSQGTQTVPVDTLPPDLRMAATAQTDFASHPSVGTLASNPDPRYSSSGVQSGRSSGGWAESDGEYEGGGRRVGGGGGGPRRDERLREGSTMMEMFPDDVRETHLRALSEQKDKKVEEEQAERREVMMALARQNAWQNTNMPVGSRRSSKSRSVSGDSGYGTDGDDADSDHADSDYGSE